MDKTYLILLTHPRCSMNSKTIQAKRATKPNENKKTPANHIETQLLQFQNNTAKETHPSAEGRLCLGRQVPT